MSTLAFALRALADFGAADTDTILSAKMTSSSSTCTEVEAYKTLMRPYERWQRADAQSGGLLGWGMHEMGIAAAADDERPRARAALLPRMGSAPKAQGGARPPSGLKRTRLTRAEVVAIYLGKLGPKSKKASGRLAEEFGITAKAVRDVWTDKTWLAETMLVKAQQHHNNFLPWGVVSLAAVEAAARVRRALYH